jgi:peptide/nickel transport system substrate-binding protein
MNQQPANGREIARRRFLTLSAAAVGALYLPACSSDDDTESAATNDTGSPGDPDETGSTTGSDPGRIVEVLRLPGMDVSLPSPFTYRGGIGYIQASYLYDTLMWKDSAGDPISWLATNVDSSSDGLGYTVTVRDGVTWHDGEPFTAADVAFSFQYLATHADQIAPSVISVPAFANIASVDVIDDTTVDFVLRQPDWTFESFTGLGGIFIFPEHIWSIIDEPGRVTDPDVLIGTGPYRLDAYEPGSGANRYVAQEEHFAGRPVVRRIEHRPVGDALAALLADEVDQAGDIGPGTGMRPQVLEPFEGSSEFEIVDAPFGHTVVGLYWNLAAGGPLADPLFRQACAIAIDRQTMIEQLFDGKAAVGNAGLLPDTNPYHVTTRDYDYDPDQAAQLLDEAGYLLDGDVRRSADGEPLQFELLTSTQQPQGPVELVARDLATVGVVCEPRSVDLPTFHERLNSGQVEMSMTTFGGTNTDEQPNGMTKVYSSTSRSLQRAQGYANERFDSLGELQRRTLDDTERAEIAAEMQAIVADDLPMLPLYYPPLTTIVRVAGVGSWSFTPGGVGGLVPSVNDKRTFILGGSDQ